MPKYKVGDKVRVKLSPWFTRYFPNTAHRLNFYISSEPIVEINKADGFDARLPYKIFSMFWVDEASLLPAIDSATRNKLNTLFKLNLQ